MSHEEVSSTGTVERYLLGELSAEQAGAFEEHYFVCRECADEVRLGAAFLANAKAVFEERRRGAEANASRPVLRVPWWKRFFALPAMIPAAALACSTLYLALIRVPHLEQELSATYSVASVPTGVLRAETRGDETRLDLPAGQRFLVLLLDVNPPRALPAYLVVLRSAAGAQVFQRKVPAPAAGESLYLLVPAKELSSGSYSLTVGEESAGPASWSSSYRFAVNKQ